MNYKPCPICGRTKFSANHKCPPRHYLLVFDGESYPQINEPQQVFADTPGDAAKDWVRQWDADTGGEMISDEETLTVWVFAPDAYEMAKYEYAELELHEIPWKDIEHEVFKVCAEAVIEYYAEKVNQ